MPGGGGAARAIGLDDNLIAVMDRGAPISGGATHAVAPVPAMADPSGIRSVPALEAAHGYDTKHGAHLVRLLRMGREIVETGSVHVWRGDRDADELLAIRAGAWSYDRLMRTRRD